jgi:hypothetical protein
MKKLRLLYITIITLGLSVTACNKELTLNPANQIELSQSLLTANDVQITLVGAYNRMGAADLYGGRIFLEPDLLAGQNALNWNGTFLGLTQIYSQAIPTNNTFIDNLWAAAYTTINQCNTVLSALDKVDAANRDRTEGEAKFIRGMTYFDLVRLFGRDWNDPTGSPTTNLGVPIVLTPTLGIDPSSFVSRSTVAQVYAQAISDLTTAESKLPVSNSYYATKYSAQAILARLYLQKSDYANASIEADNVISSNAFQLTSSYAAEFPYPGQTHVANTSEDVFDVQVTNQQGVNSLNTFYASSADGGRGDIDINPSFYAQFEPGDARATFYTVDQGLLRTAKFRNVYGNVKVIRLAELYLIRAEANFRLNKVATNGSTPSVDVNVVRARAGLPAIVATLPAILKERVSELSFEDGFFLFDAKRLNTPVKGLSPYSPKLVFPIPLVETNTNPNLVQNTGY